MGFVLLLLLVVAGALIARPDGADPISEGDALASFREKDPGSPVVPGDGTSAGRSTGDQLPTPGVYSYDTDGFEVVKLGPLPAESRPLHAITTAEVTAVSPDGADPGCFSFALNLLEQHTEESTYCRTTGGGVRLESYAKHQTIAQFDATVNISCDPGTLWNPTENSLPLECTLTLDGGPMEVSTDFSGTAVAAAPTIIDIGTDSVEVVAVDVHFDLEGSVLGTWDEHLWFDTASALTVKLERDFHLGGFVNFDEEIDLLARSMTPSR